MASHNPVAHPPGLLTAQEAADHLGISLKCFYETVRWEIAVIKTSPGRSGKILVEFSELERWKALHREVPVGYREVSPPAKRQPGGRSR